LLSLLTEIFWDHYQSLFAPGARATNAHFFRIGHASPQGLLYPVMLTTPRLITVTE
jgi:hypothetical protein